MPDYFLTLKAANAAAATKNAEPPKARGKSSGHEHIDYVVKPTGKLFRRFAVVERST